MASTVDAATGELRVTLSGTPDTCLKVNLPDWTEYITIQSQGEIIKFSYTGTDGGAIGTHYGSAFEKGLLEKRISFRPGGTPAAIYLASETSSAVVYVCAERGGAR